MRSIKDRIRHTLLYELTGMIIAVPLFSWLMDTRTDLTGILAVGLSLVAMIWNYGYNLGFDHALRVAGRPLHVRPAWLRALHAVGFEGTLLLVTLPMVAWWLGLSWREALMMDIGMAAFYTIHAYGYNWTYDRVFPMPEDIH